MSMIVTIVAVFPMEVEPHELPRVECRTFIVQTESIQEGYDSISGFASAIDATEVWAVETRELCVTPDHRLTRQELLSEWQSWVHWQLTDGSGWIRVHQGPENFQQRIDRLFAERRPEFA